MNISRERYLDDTSRHRVTVELQTHTYDTHSLLSDAADDVRKQVGEVLVRALDEVQALLKPLLEAKSPV